MSGWSNCPVKAPIVRPSKTGSLKPTTTRCSVTNKLVEADAKSRTENVELHRQIEAERSGIDQQRDALEQERRQIAEQRNLIRLSPTRFRQSPD